jgi:hypothetical protein
MTSFCMRPMTYAGAETFVQHFYAIAGCTKAGTWPFPEMERCLIRAMSSDAAYCGHLPRGGMLIPGWNHWDQWFVIAQFAEEHRAW